MASRIDIEPDTNGYRCFWMYLKSDENTYKEAIRMMVKKPEVEPIIAKGNRFDGVDAWY